MHAGNLEKVRSEFSHDFSLASIDYVNTNETKLMLISTGRGVGFVPSFVDVSCYPDLVTRPLTPIYRPRKYYAVARKGVLTNMYKVVWKCWHSTILRICGAISSQN